MRKKGGSGIYFYSNKKHKDDFYFFLQHSTFKYLNKGSNGLTIVGELNEEIISPYKDKFQEPINCILIKLVAIDVEELIHINIDPVRYVNTSLKSSFEKEAKFQINLFKKTSDYFSPLCPAIVYYDIIETNLVQHFTTSLHMNEDKCNIFFENLIKTNCSLGIIGMEFAKEYCSIYKIKDDKKKIWAICAYVILKMAIETGYSHADFHITNIMASMDGDYFDSYKIHPLLIDFGFVQKIDSEKMIQIRIFINEKKYTNALKMICTVPRSDGLNITTKDTKINKNYGYLCGTYNLIEKKEMDDFPEDFNKWVDTIFKKRKKFIENKISENKIIRTLQEKHHLNTRKKLLDVIKTPHLMAKDRALHIINTKFSANKTSKIYRGSIQPTLPMTNYLKSKLLNVNDGEKIQILVHFDFSNQLYITVNTFKSLIEWLYVNVLIKIDIHRRLKIFIEVCYNVVYLINKNDNIEKLDIYLIGFVALYFSSDFYYYISAINNTNIFDVFGLFISNKDIIKSEIKKQSPLFDNISIKTFYDNLSQSEKNKYNKITISELFTQITLPEFYVPTFKLHTKTVDSVDSDT